MKKLNIDKKQWKYGTLSTAAIVIFVAVVVLLNVVVSMLDDRYSLQLDLTANKVFSISDTTKDYLKALDKDVKITVFAEENELSTTAVYYKQIVETINTYDRLSDKITVDYVNPNTNPEIVAQFRNLYTGDLSDKLIILQCGDKIRALSQYDLIDYNQVSLSSKAENALTTGISIVSDDNTAKIAVMDGTPADDISAFISALSSNGYEVVTVDPLTGAIPEDASALIIPCPTIDYSQETIRKIRTFLDNGGEMGKNLIYISSLYQGETPNIDALTAEYGLKAGDGYVQDTDIGNLADLGGGIYAIVSYISNGNYTQGMQNSALPVIVPLAQPIEFTDSENVYTESLLSTSDTAVVIPLESDGELDISSLAQGAQSVIAVGTKVSGEASGNCMVISSSLMLNSGLLSYKGYNNGEYPISAINKLTGKENSVAIVAKDLTATPLEMNLAQATLFRNTAMYFIPLALLIIGFAVWYRRKNR